MAVFRSKTGKLQIAPLRPGEYPSQLAQKESVFTELISLNISETAQWPLEEQHPNQMLGKLLCTFQEGNSLHYLVTARSGAEHFKKQNSPTSSQILDRLLCFVHFHQSLTLSH